MTSLSKIRSELKRKLLARDQHCRGCGRVFLSTPHMHEGIISRKEVQKWSAENRALIHHPYNCVLLCPDCNLGHGGKSPPPRVQIWTEHCQRYGLDVMRAWLNNLPFKCPPHFPDP